MCDLNRTHRHSASRYCVSLINGDPLRGIHHVSDAVLFEETLSQEKKNALMKRSDSTNEGKCEITRLGYKYEDKAHTEYQMLNGVGGVLLYYYSFTTQQGLQSVVNS